jgi:hypothetical protein
LIPKRIFETPVNAGLIKEEDMRKGVEIFVEMVNKGSG